jgi:exosortase/archaeosortase family protein
MMAFFLGESDRWRAGRRIALLGGAVLAALAVNVARTTVLTWAFGRLGPDAEERWHDPAGVIALIVTLLLVWFCSERLNRAAPVIPAAANGSVMGAPAWRPLLLALVCVGIIEAGTQAWYGWHERGGPGQRVSWELKPANDSGWTPVEVPPRSAEILRYESGDSYARELSMPSRQMLAFAFRWSGDLAQIGAPEAHNPLICLPSVGAVKEAELPEARVVVDGVEVAFRFVRFRQGDRLQHVWFSLWSTRTGHADTARLLTNDVAELRLSRVLAGVRNDEREQLIFFVQGESDDAGAAQTLHDAVLTLMRRQSFVRP